VVTAFSRSPLRVSHISVTKSSIPTSLGGVDNGNDDGENISHDLMLDESVMLYSQVSRQICCENNTEIETLRKNELTSLIEDIVFDERGAVDLQEDRASMKNNEDEKEKEPEPETLDEISRALDQQILLGYQSAFTEKELEQWVKRIDTLYEKLQLQAAALPAASSTTDTSTPKATATTPFDQLLSRIESMRTLIDPVGNARGRPPLAQLVVNPVPSPPPLPVPTDTKIKDKITDQDPIAEIPLETSLPDDASGKFESSNNPIEISDRQNSALNNSGDIHSVSSGNNKPVPVPVPSPPPLPVKRGEKIEDKITDAIIEIPLEISLPDDTSSNTDSSDDDIEISDKQNPTPNNSSDAQSVSSGNSESMPSPSPPSLPVKADTKIKDKIKDQVPILETSLPDDASRHVESSNDPIEISKIIQNPTTNNSSDIRSIPSGNNWVEVPADIDYIPTNAFGGDNDNETSSSANITVSADIYDDQPELCDANTTVMRDGADVVTAIVTTAALSAAAITKLPLFVVGVALGPVLSDSVAYAKGRMTNPAKLTSLENDKNSTPGEKDEGESDVVEDGKEAN